MNIYIVSRAQEERLHTPKLLQAAGVPYTLVLDNGQQADAARRLGHRRVMVTDTGDLVAKRNAITAAVGRGWYCGMDDNIQGFAAVDGGLRRKHSVDGLVDTADGQNWRPFFNKNCSVKDYVKELQALAVRCDSFGACYGGVATMENPYFRGKRFGFRRFVKSKVFVMRAEAGIRFKHRLCHDSFASAQAVAFYGRVLVDNWLFYRARWYEQGGLGSRAAREAAGLLQQLQACCSTFPGLVGLARGKNSALRFLRTSDASVNRWRIEHGYLKGDK
jgi:hypothetical protein